jgi:uncharacterized coiled-coil DUF342 family protein
MTTSTPRQRKTARKRAEDTLAEANQRVDKLKARRDEARQIAVDLANRYDDAVARRNYAAKDPALGDTTTPKGDTP